MFINPINIFSDLTFIGERMESMSSEETSEICPGIPDYLLEKEAIKIGDALNSHISLNRSRKEFTRNFSITFEFRTFYPNGLFILLRGSSKRKVRYHFLLALRGGRVIADLKEKKRHQLISGDYYHHESPLNDGKWHNVTVTKEGRLLWLRTDDGKRVETKVRKKLPLRSPMLIGGFPIQDLKILYDGDIPIYESFRGCLRNFQISNEYIDLVAYGSLNNVSQCCTQIIIK